MGYSAATTSSATKSVWVNGDPRFYGEITWNCSIVC